jgi:hypothetical protein
MGVHVERRARVDGFGSRTEPRWFNARLAVVVGNEPRHSEAVWLEARRRGVPVPPLNEMETFCQSLDAVGRFHKNPTINPKELNVVYSAAGHAVRTWYGRAGRAGLLDMIAALRDGENFRVAHERISNGHAAAGRRLESAASPGR